MKNILLPTDFSNNSQNAIRYAMEFYKNELCTFYIIHIQKALRYTTDDLMAAPSNISIHGSIIGSAKSKLNQLMEQLKESFPNQNYSFNAITDYDIFTDAIQQAVQAHHIDLIIMGTNGATGASEVVFGSNTLKVIRKIDCPVLIIPEGFPFKTPKNILYAIDHDDHFEQKEIDPLTHIMNQYKPVLHVLKIKEDDTISIAEFDDKKSMKKIFEDFDCSFHTIANIPTASAVNSFVQIMDIDMTAIFIKRETFLERFLKGSETSKISYGTLVPLLIIPSHK